MERFDIAVCGAGTAGLSSAATLCAAGLSVGVIDPLWAGGRVSSLHELWDQTSDLGGQLGAEVATSLVERAIAENAAAILDEVERVDAAPGGLVDVVAMSKTYRVRAVVVATGMKIRRLDVPGAAECMGHGLSQCASCDGPIYGGQRVLVIGGGDSGVGEACVLADHASSVKVVFREPQLHCSPERRARIERLDNVSFSPDTEVVAVERVVGAVRVHMRRGGQRWQEDVAGVFSFGGLEPAVDWHETSLAVDEFGQIKVDAFLQTSREGVFAIGDARVGTGLSVRSAQDDGEHVADAIKRWLQRVPFK